VSPPERISDSCTPRTTIEARSRRPIARVACALAALLALTGNQATGGQDPFDTLHARIRAAEAKRTSIRARFVETTTSTLLVKPMVSRGSLIGEKPARMVISYVSPEHKTILMDGQRLFVTQDGREDVEQIDIIEIMKTVNKYFTNADPGQLRRAFTIRAFPDPETPTWHQVDLLPKRKQIKQGLERLQLWVSGDYMLTRMTMTFAGGDTTVFELLDVELNVPVAPGIFDPPVPPAPPAKKKR
jgi:outer membrane lipoprotein-sorting protein